MTVESYEERERDDIIRATIHVERDSQKGMVIGRGAKVVKAISMGARKRIEDLTGRPCQLFLQVRVDRNWTKDPVKLERFGYREGGRS